MSEEKLSWEEMMATEPDLIGFNSNSVKRIVERAIEEEREKWKKAVRELKVKINEDLKLTLTTSKLKTDSEESKIIQEAIYKIEIKIYNELGFIIDLAFKDLVEG